MPETPRPEDPQNQVETASKAFEQEFERFARFTGSWHPALALAEAEEEQRTDRLRTRHLGKSALPVLKKALGGAPESRAAFGQVVRPVKSNRKSYRKREVAFKTSSIIT